MEMHAGGSQLFFDLFVALCNHVDDVASIALVFRLIPLSLNSSHFNLSLSCDYVLTNNSGSPRSVRTHH